MTEPAYEDYDNIGGLLARHGLALRGGFQCWDEGDLAKELKAVVPDATVLVLVGDVGGSIWPYFSAWREQDDHKDLENPLDQWSKHVIDDIATATDGSAVYPWDQPYLPFQKWAAYCEGLETTPLGILMHPEYGLWHAYRGAIALPYKIDLPDAPQHDHLCDTCERKPCIAACPVGAFDDGLDVEACAGHLNLLHRDFAEPDCLSFGCEARNACPFGRMHRYERDQRQFHMSAYHRSVG